PLKATPPGTAVAAMSSGPSSATSSGSSPRGQLAKKFSERLEDNDQHRSEQDQHREFVEPAEPDVALRVTVRREIAQQHAAPQVVGREQRAERHLDVQPARGAAEPAEPQPDPKDEGEHAARGHDAPIELALHELEALARGRVLGHGVVDEESRQVKQSREPGHHEDDVEGLDPEHQAEKRRRANMMAMA